jgi:hypothetical protein
MAVLWISSRSAGRHSIQLLGDLDEKILLKYHSPEFLLEDDHLERLNSETQRAWKKILKGVSIANVVYSPQIDN